MTRRFWNWETPPDPSTGSSPGELPARRVLRIGGVIAEDSWFDDDVTPGIFRSELEAGAGPVDVWINSPGGDCIAAAQIYTMLMDYPHPVRVIIDGLAASAASVIAMAGSEVLMSPPAMMMIHNPATLANGDADELARAIDMLGAVKDSIITAYEIKTSMQRARIGRLMDDETWMDARAAINLGFADAIYNPTGTPLPAAPTEDGSEGGGVVFSAIASERSLVNKLTSHTTSPATPTVARPVRVPAPGASLTQPTGRKVADLYAALADRPH
ncbi:MULTISPECIES: head maturation protease, ClpP-related [Actinomycetaceae]|uniref:ATP-dependent Clp protease proteolytic subunit n=1 Tax=Trueperella abortisuis TaxID=445930 RepID=A0ABT9PJD1_9ACTO|nr:MULTISPECIES: head maturation protease, ClpP-related [Actinomycetaceae]MCI7305515.1 Clp protease ClpP [Trueperella sp.]MCI7456921.1 Clp protease ClpP [Actinomyces urogenitalis]MDP9832821.1 ATP-dependent Clp protease protease subunit [Trueperella abortisuis]